MLASPVKALVKQHKLEGEPPGKRGTQRPLGTKKMLRQLASWAGMHICPTVQKSEVGAQTQDQPGYKWRAPALTASLCFPTINAAQSHCNLRLAHPRLACYMLSTWLFYSFDVIHYIFILFTHKQLYAFPGNLSLVQKKSYALI